MHGCPCEADQGNDGFVHYPSRDLQLIGNKVLPLTFMFPHDTSQEELWFFTEVKMVFK